jgi:predicted transcriptional regulator
MRNEESIKMCLADSTCYIAFIVWLTVRVILPLLFGWQYVLYFLYCLADSTCYIAFTVWLTVRLILPLLFGWKYVLYCLYCLADSTCYIAFTVWLTVHIISLLLFPKKTLFLARKLYYKLDWICNRGSVCWQCGMNWNLANIIQVILSVVMPWFCLLISSEYWHFLNTRR